MKKTDNKSTTISFVRNVLSSKLFWSVLNDLVRRFKQLHIFRVTSYLIQMHVPFCVVISEPIFEYTQKNLGIINFLGLNAIFRYTETVLSGLKRWLKSLGLLEIFKYAWKSLSTLKILSMLEPNFEKADGLGIGLRTIVTD